MTSPVISLVPYPPIPPGPVNAATDFTSGLEAYEVAAESYVHGDGGVSDPVLHFGAAEFLVHGSLFWITDELGGVLRAAPSMSIEHVVNDGLIVFRNDGYGGNIQMFWEIGQLRQGQEIFNNSGEIYAYSDQTHASVIKSAYAGEYYNSGLIAVYSGEYTANAIYLSNGGLIHNYASGTILAEGPGALAVFTNSSVLEGPVCLINEGWIEARNVTDGKAGFTVSPAIAVQIEYFGEVQNSGTIAGNIGIVLNGVLTNSGSIYAAVAVYSSEFIAFNNQAGGHVVGNLVFGDLDYPQGGYGNPDSGSVHGDIVTNAGLIVGDVFMGGHDDRFVNSGIGEVTGLVFLEAGNDLYVGGTAADAVSGGLGDDTIDGGGGFDFALYLDAAGPVSVDLAVTTAQSTGNAGSDSLTNIEGLAGSDFNDQLWGNAQDNILDGVGGADQLHGRLGDDTYCVDTPDDLVFENADEGTDTVISTASHYLFANVENLSLQFGAGNVFGVGNALANIIEGNEGANLLAGGDGGDQLHGYEGEDSIFGEAGNDELFGEGGIDYLVGGAGDDALNGGADADALYGEDGNDVLTGGEGFVTDILVGGAGNDVLFANSGENDYDLIDGGSGDDLYYVDTGDDLTFEATGGGTDTVYANVSNVPNSGVYLYANVENLVLIGTTAFGVGNELSNTLTGSASTNWLLGGAGSDTINGKGGNDVLFGEAGSDTFVFEQGSGGDVIGDFNAAEDKIDLSAFGFASFAALQANFIQNGNVGAINLGNGDFIVLHGVTMASLDAGDFIF